MIKAPRVLKWLYSLEGWIAWQHSIVSNWRYSVNIPLIPNFSTTFSFKKKKKKKKKKHFQTMVLSSLKRMAWEAGWNLSSLPVKTTPQPSKHKASTIPSLQEHSLLTHQLWREKGFWCQRAWILPLTQQKLLTQIKYPWNSWHRNTPQTCPPWEMQTLGVPEIMAHSKRYTASALPG